MDINALLQPRITDREALAEFAEALTDQIPDLERCIAQLRRVPRDRELIATLFRGLHTIKGDAAMCKVDVGVMITHPIEGVLSRLREGQIEFTELLAEVVLLALDRLELAVESITGGRRLDQLHLPELVGGLEAMGKAPAGDIDEHAIRLIENVTGFRPTAAAHQLKPKPPVSPRDKSGDLKFFHSLAVAFESRSTLFKGRSGRLLRLALDTNTTAGKPVDPVQLEAAVYMHDVGMMFLPESIWLNVGKLDADQMRMLHEHADQAAGLLSRMTGWDAAAEMVVQHHEMTDGRGYPRGLNGDAICPGAKILAIIDAFEAVTLKQSHRGQSRSLLRAIAEINACDTQFAPEWIGPFNDVIRHTLES